MNKRRIGVEKIVSGGQTGVDRAALDAAAGAGVPAGGWCPRGRRAEDGPIPDTYPLQETPSGSYDERTRWNVRDSHGTLIVYAGQMDAGTRLTARVAEQLGKPLLVVDMDEADEACVQAWIRLGAIAVVNVAGPRESTSPGVYERALEFLTNVFRKVVYRT